MEIFTFELIDQVARRLDLQVRRDMRFKVLILRKGLLGVLHRLSEFPISLSIQLVCPDKHMRSRFFSGVHHDHIGRNPLVLLNFNNISDSDLDRLNGLLDSSLVDSVILLRVQILVSPTSEYIVPGFFDHGNNEDKHERSDISEGKADFESGYEL